jgi:hypothetical protein
VHVESTLPGISADCTVIDENKEIMTIKSPTSIGVKAVTVGDACLQSRYINKGNIGFPSPFISSHPAECSQSDRGAGPGTLTAIELERFPSSGIGSLAKYPGIDKVVLRCSIAAPSIKLDLQDGRDIWLHHFRSSPSQSYDYRLAKSVLTVTHGSSSVTASITGERNGDLRLETTFTDTGYVRAAFVLRRDLGNTFIDQQIADIKNEKAGTSGAATLHIGIWRPVFRSFDFILICDSKMNGVQFLPKLPIFGAQPTDPTRADAAKPLGPGGYGDFVLSDGTDIKYTVRMTGYRRLLSDDDEAGMSLQLSS